MLGTACALWIPLIPLYFVFRRMLGECGATPRACAWRLWWPGTAAVAGDDLLQYLHFHRLCFWFWLPPHVPFFLGVLVRHADGQSGGSKRRKADSRGEVPPTTFDDVAGQSPGTSAPGLRHCSVQSD